MKNLRIDRLTQEMMTRLPRVYMTDPDKLLALCPANNVSVFPMSRHRVVMLTIARAIAANPDANLRKCAIERRIFDLKMTGINREDAHAEIANFARNLDRYFEVMSDDPADHGSGGAA